MHLIERLLPVFPSDEGEWQDLKNEINGSIPPLFWYGGAAFDREPVVKVLNNCVPPEVRDSLSPNIFPVLTDYSDSVISALKEIYDKLDEEDGDQSDFHNRYWFRNQLSDVTLLQMIPLTLFNPNELESIRNTYTDFHPCVTSSVIPDDRWHFVFLLCESGGIEFPLFYGLIENLVFWKEVVEKYDLDVEAFCALRVGGKSGSWDHTHSPSIGKLFKSIRSSQSKKPIIWIADDCFELRKIWREINPHDEGFYGQMHYFATGWRN